MFFCSKMLSVLSSMSKMASLDDVTVKIFVIGVLTKMAWSTTKIGFITQKMFGRLAKIEYSLTAKGGCTNSLQYFGGQKMAAIEMRLQDQVSTPNDCGRKITNYLWDNLDKDPHYLLIGIGRIKDYFWSARLQQQDCIVMMMDKIWFKVLDYALSVLVQKIADNGQMTPEIMSNIREVQQKECGFKKMAEERFGSVQGQVEQVEQRAWL